jgi:hypothetical protein
MQVVVKRRENNTAVSTEGEVVTLDGIKGYAILTRRFITMFARNRHSSLY